MWVGKFESSQGDSVNGIDRGLICGWSVVKIFEAGFQNLAPTEKI